MSQTQVRSVNGMSQFAWLYLLNTDANLLTDNVTMGKKLFESVA
jgi:hypothetical protein